MVDISREAEIKMQKGAKYVSAWSFGPLGIVFMEMDDGCGLVFVIGVWRLRISFTIFWGD